jgi:hypothetical protein
VLCAQNLRGLLNWLSVQPLVLLLEPQREAQASNIYASVIDEVHTTLRYRHSLLSCPQLLAMLCPVPMHRGSLPLGTTCP